MLRREVPPDDQLMTSNSNLANYCSASRSSLNTFRLPAAAHMIVNSATGKRAFHGDSSLLSGLSVL